MRVFGRQTPGRAMKVNGGGNPSRGAHHRPIRMSSDGFE